MPKTDNKNKSFVTQMSEEEKVIFLKILVALARADGNFDDEEKLFIKDAAIVFGLTKDHVDTILEPMSDEEIVESAKKITNRQAALQLIKEACLLANSDGDLSDEEIVLIGKIGQAMNVELEKIEEISQWVIERIIWLEKGKIIFEQL